MVGFLEVRPCRALVRLSITVDLHTSKHCSSQQLTTGLLMTAAMLLGGRETGTNGGMHTQPR